jgi:hypothetical protein
MLNTVLAATTKTKQTKQQWARTSGGIHTNHPEFGVFVADNERSD